VQPDDRAVRAGRPVAAGGDLGAADRDAQLADLLDRRPRADQLGEAARDLTRSDRVELPQRRPARVVGLLEKRLRLGV
jgi:hypothetical protein